MFEFLFFSELPFNRYFALFVVIWLILMILLLLISIVLSWQTLYEYFSMTQVVIYISV